MQNLNSALGETPVMILSDEHGILAATTWRGDEACHEDPYSGFSLCHYTGDGETHFMKCRRRLTEWCGVGNDKLFVPRQTHSVNVAVITQQNIATVNIDNHDALVTDMPGIIIGVNTADCVPVIMYDPENRVVAAAHAGWRGAVGGIVENTMDAMTRLNADPRSIRAIICPAICAGCFEVGEEVAARFPENRVMRHNGCRPHVDLPGYVGDCMENKGVLRSNICQTGECTRCHPMKYFSARASGINSGRNFSFVMIRPPQGHNGAGFR